MLPWISDRDNEGQEPFKQHDNLQTKTFFVTTYKKLYCNTYLLLFKGNLSRSFCRSEVTTHLENSAIAPPHETLLYFAFCNVTVCENHRPLKKSSWFLSPLFDLTHIKIGFIFIIHKYCIFWPLNQAFAIRTCHNTNALLQAGNYAAFSIYCINLMKENSIHGHYKFLKQKLMFLYFSVRL